MTKVNVDSHKLMFHPERVAEWRATGDCFPIYVEIGPTNRCNHRCAFCALDWLQRGGADLDREAMCRNLKDMAEHGVKSVMFAGEGEPLLHKDIGTFVKTAREAGLDVAMTSNGALLSPSVAREILPHLSWIRFSIDAGTPETYAKVHGVRGGEFPRVMWNVYNAVEIKRKGNYPVVIGAQALLTCYSINELESLGSQLKAIGVDNFQIKPYSHHPLSRNDLSFDLGSAETVRPRLEALEDEKFQVAYRAGTIARLQQAREYTRCHGLPFFALVDARANVIPCGLFYGNEEFTYGNIGEKLFSEIWRGEKRKQIVEKIDAAGIENCREGCRLDVINRYLEKVRRGAELESPAGERPVHVNFI